MNVRPKLVDGSDLETRRGDRGGMGDSSDNAVVSRLQCPLMPKRIYFVQGGLMVIIMRFSYIQVTSHITDHREGSPKEVGMASPGTTARTQYKTVTRTQTHDEPSQS